MRQESMLGKNLKRVRKSCGFSSKEVAKSLGISQSALSNYEAGIREPNLKIIWNLANLYQVTVDQLLQASIGGQLEPAEGTEVPIYDQQGQRTDQTVVTKLPTPGQRYFAAKVWDSSMEKKRICLGDTIICQAVRQVEEPGIYVLRRPETIIRYAAKKGDWLLLTPYSNDTTFKTERIPVALAEPVGKVVEVKIKI